MCTKKNAATFEHIATYGKETCHLGASIIVLVLSAKNRSILAKRVEDGPLFKDLLTS